MARSVTGQLSANISWSQRDTDITDVIGTNVGEFKYSQDLTSGPLASGTTDKSSEIFHNTYTLPAGQSLEFDLTNLTKTLFGNSFTVNFNSGNIKGLIINNLNTNIASQISITATGSNAWDAPFRGGSGNIEINPNSSLPFFNPFGWNISSSNCKFQINDVAGSGVEFEVAIIGQSG